MESQFEILGYFEEVWDAKRRKLLGTRRVPEDKTRKPSTEGERQETVTTPLVLTVGHKTITVRASTDKPLQVFTRYMPLCGRLKNSR